MKPIERVLWSLHHTHTYTWNLEHKQNKVKPEAGSRYKHHYRVELILRTLHIIVGLHSPPSPTYRLSPIQHVLHRVIHIIHARAMCCVGGIIAHMLITIKPGYFHADFGNLGSMHILIWYPYACVRCMLRVTSVGRLMCIVCIRPNVCMCACCKWIFATQTATASATYFTCDHIVVTHLVSRLDCGHCDVSQQQSRLQLYQSTGGEIQTLLYYITVA